MCHPYVKESFLIAVPQSCHRDIQPCIVSSVDFSFQKSCLYLFAFLFCASETVVTLEKLYSWWATDPVFVY